MCKSRQLTLLMRQRVAVQALARVWEAALAEEQRALQEGTWELDMAASVKALGHLMAINSQALKDQTKRVEALLLRDLALS